MNLLHGTQVNVDPARLDGLALIGAPVGSLSLGNAVERLVSSVGGTSLNIAGNSGLALGKVHELCGLSGLGGKGLELVGGDARVTVLSGDLKPDVAASGRGIEGDLVLLSGVPRRGVNGGSPVVGAVGDVHVVRRSVVIIRLPQNAEATDGLLGAHVNIGPLRSIGLSGPAGSVIAINEVAGRHSLICR